MHVSLEPAVRRAERLMAREVELREAGREAELDPRRAADARRYFTRASQARRLRLTVLRRIGVL